MRKNSKVVLVAASLWVLLHGSAWAKSTFPAPPRLKKIPESSVHPVMGVPRKIDQEKFVISDTYAFSDKKVQEIPVWYMADRDFLFAGTVPPGSAFEPEAQLPRFGRTFYGTTKIEGMKTEPWVASLQSRSKNMPVTLFVDGGYVQRQP
ncbi:MAG: hypothetical protein RIQ81_95 [Pseudomonadota bacterium]|jgi:hypothetical protein